LSGKIVEDLGKEYESDAGGVFEVGGDGSGKTVGADVAVDDVGFVGDGLALAHLGAFGEGFREECEHFFDSLNCMLFRVDVHGRVCVCV